MSSLEVTIEKLVHGGDGLARLPDGKVIFVPETIPGERVQVEIRQKFKDYALARVKRVLLPSPTRKDPPCVYFPACGGCQLQHIEYKAQLDYKLAVFKETLSRIGEIPLAVLENCLPSPEALGYRHRLQFHVHQGTGALGFLKRRSHDLVPLKRCLLARPEINEVLERLPHVAAWKRLHPYVTRVNLGVSLAEKKVCMLFWTQVPPRREDLEEIRASLPVLKAIFYWVRGREPEGPFPQEAPHRGRRLFPVPPEVSGLQEEAFFFAAPGVFVQANWEVNLALISAVKLYARPEKGLPILDLHSGMGNFLLPLGVVSRVGLGVDTDHRAIADARYNQRKWGLSDLSFEVSSALEALLNFLKEGERFPVVLLDPPRGGCKELLRFLPDLVEERLIYISCDPPTLARDLNILLKSGFDLELLKPFDMFPQTFHLESLALLRRQSSP